jgi:hypothetical protein
MTIFTKMYYYPGEHYNCHIAVFDKKILTANYTSTCVSLEAQIDDSVSLVGCIDSGATVTFHCPPGLVLGGTNSLTCMANAHRDWNLELNEVNCSGIQ